jgi:DNA-binding LacI/PurR family transcriptional regulator
MSTLPKRVSLVSQTVAFLRDQISKGGWNEWLPSERALCNSLLVSRNTLRAALEQLKREGLIDAKHGAGNHINVRKKTKNGSLRSHDVAILTPDPLEQLRPTQTLWIDEMRAMLSERGCQLHVFHGRQYFRANPGPALSKLVIQHSHGCWILMLSSEKTQTWFEKNNVPCVLAGSVHQGINLPFRDLDHRAICRHAAGVMLGEGHRKIGLIIQKSRLAGDLESEAGFIAGVGSSRHTDAEAVIANHEPNVAGLRNSLRRLMEQKRPPTALLVANPYYYLTVISWLNQHGWRVPEDISVLSRDDEAFLSYILPEPARYVTDPHMLANSLLRPVLDHLEGGVITHRAIRIIPEFVRGESLTAPRSS